MRSTSKFFTWLECGWDQWCNYACNILNSPFLNFSARFQTVLRLICCLFSTSSWKTQWNSLWLKNNRFFLSKDKMKKEKIGGAEGLRNYGRSKVHLQCLQEINMLCYERSSFSCLPCSSSGCITKRLMPAWTLAKQLVLLSLGSQCFPWLRLGNIETPGKRKLTVSLRSRRWENNNRLIMVDYFCGVIVISIGTFEKGLSKFLVLITKSWN